MRHGNEMEILKDIVKPLKRGIVASNLFASGATVLALYSFSAPPIVVLSDGTGKNFFTGKRRPVSATKDNVKVFLKDFVLSRYASDGSGRESVLENISPMVTAGLLKKIKQSIKAKRGVRRSVASVEVSFAEKGAWVSFHLIEEVRGIPFVVSKKLFVQLKRGGRTRWNPMGIYINRITVYEKNTKGD